MPAKGARRVKQMAEHANPVTPAASRNLAGSDFALQLQVQLGSGARRDLRSRRAPSQSTERYGTL
jgi:hypothetical protein